MNEHEYVSIISNSEKDTYIKCYRKYHINKNYKKIYDHLIAEKIIFDSETDNYLEKCISNKSKLVLDEDNYYLNFLNIKFPRNLDGFIVNNYVTNIIRVFNKLSSNGYNIKYNYGFTQFSLYNLQLSVTTKNILEKELKKKSKEEINKKLSIIESVEIIPYFQYNTQSDFVLDALNTPIIINFDSRPNLFV
jgi:hypothetical protein